MSQFSKFVERSFTPPPAAARIINVLLLVGVTVQAVGTRRLQDLLLAVFLFGMLVPAGISAKGFTWLIGRMQARPVLGSVYSALLLTCGGFALLAHVLPRRTSLLVAIGLALSSVVVAEIRRRWRAASSPRPDGRGELG
ncbi:hypothetical protein EV651_108187 [Kribbella sp. VKM Ac-2571]|uniref:hypothetical protein n=1 Tax=Kribbella sp. VKM Ac-2571 TaxID=2512222 RepID=UPI0010617017|nr:hypothetical protein [Kribbella sp. VKM Ac-2571]TDO59841.1 hypothetical protein EV651_108187 [Kribbella sp. VKM Ac-2571]